MGDLESDDTIGQSEGWSHALHNLTFSEGTNLRAIEMLSLTDDRVRNNHAPFLRHKILHARWSYPGLPSRRRRNCNAGSRGCRCTLHHNSWRRCHCCRSLRGCQRGCCCWRCSSRGLTLLKYCHRGRNRLLRDNLWRWCECSSSHLLLPCVRISSAWDLQACPRRAASWRRPSEL